MLFMITGGLGVHFRLNSYKTSPISGLMKQMLPFSSPISKGMYYKLK